MQAGHIQPTASDRHRPVSASISSLLGNVRNDRPGPLRRQIWQMTHSEFMLRHGTDHRSRPGRRTGADRLHHAAGPQSASRTVAYSARTSNEGHNVQIRTVIGG